MELAEIFSRGTEGWEPGPYYIVEVLRRESKSDEQSIQIDDDKVES